MIEKSSSLIDQLCQWQSTVSAQKGVVVGCSQNHEYLLPWWWTHYRAHNAYPVTFFDFGDLSSEAREWCQKHGSLITLPPIEQFIIPKEKIALKDVSTWESHKNLDIWKARSEWFKKPLACLHSPYQRTIWFDLDCQIFNSIERIFEFCEPDTLAVVEEPELIRLIHEDEGLIPPGAMEYNTGVIAFEHQVTIIEEWLKKCFESNKNCRGDQEVLAHLLHEKRIQLNKLPTQYNWRGDCIPNEDFMEFLVVIHWLGSCKEVIRWQIDQMSKN